LNSIEEEAEGEVSPYGMFQQKGNAEGSSGDVLPDHLAKMKAVI